MSTRGAIGRLLPDGSWQARYHHFDSYPSGLGRALYLAYRGFFNRSVERMLEYLVDEHPAGWSTIVDADFARTPGYRNYDEIDDNAPHCYCHGDRHEEAWEVTQENAAGSGVEYAYLFDGTSRMRILSSYSGAHKMIGMFGQGDPDSTWVEIAAVDLDGPEPNWQELD